MASSSEISFVSYSTQKLPAPRGTLGRRCPRKVLSHGIQRIVLRDAAVEIDKAADQARVVEYLTHCIEFDTLAPLRADRDRIERFGSARARYQEARLGQVVDGELRKHASIEELRLRVPSRIALLAAPVVAYCRRSLRGRRRRTSSSYHRSSAEVGIGTDHRCVS